ncbi:MAG TPA: lipopolysaccharide biosynthesis protein [Actinomycetales bacterium]|nr:lipopolysaccharide biosynthesis protein [Actinomycetales bacterium]
MSAAFPRRSRFVAGAMWSSAGVVAQSAAQFVVLAVLARLLVPADFGVITASLIVVGFARLATTEGVVGPAVTQMQDLRTEHVGAAFVLSMGTGALATVAVWAASPAVVALFDMPALLDVTRVLSLSLGLQSFGAVPLALLLRELKFKSVALVDVGSYLIGYAFIGCLLAALGAGVWSLVGAYLGQSAIQTVALLLLRRHPVTWRLRWAPAKQILTFGSGHTLGRYLNYAALQGDFFIVGRYMSDVLLGVYGRAYQLATAPALLLGGVLDKTLFPTLAARQGSPERLVANYLRAVRLNASLTAPAAAVLTVLAPELVDVLLGPGWDATVLPLQILAVTLTFRAGYKVADAMAKARGAVFNRAGRQALYAVAVIGGAYAAYPYGIAAVAGAVSLAITANYLIMGGLAVRLAGASWLDFLVSHGRGLLIGALTAAGAWSGASLARWYELPNLLAVVLGAVGGAVVCGGAAALRPRLVLGADLLWFLGQLRSRRAHSTATGRP